MQESLHTTSHFPAQKLLRAPCETFICRYGARARTHMHSYRKRPDLQKTLTFVLKKGQNPSTFNLQNPSLKDEGL